MILLIFRKIYKLSNIKRIDIFKYHKKFVINRKVFIIEKFSEEFEIL